LGRLFQAGEVGKTYWAIVRGGPPDEEGVIDLPLGRRDKTRGWWMKVDPEGVAAITGWRVLGRAADPRHGAIAAMALAPLTGRTHQLRVHCAAMGWPILGDQIYGEAPRIDEPTLHLHARAVTLPLYPKRSALEIEAPAPAHMRAALAATGIIS
jgi:tRNA pseudouridine32 synthase/23S rRNA pseudouridine746 synthase